MTLFLLHFGANLAKAVEQLENMIKPSESTETKKKKIKKQKSEI